MVLATSLRRHCFCVPSIAQVDRWFRHLDSYFHGIGCEGKRPRNSIGRGQGVQVEKSPPNRQV